MVSTRSASNTSALPSYSGLKNGVKVPRLRIPIQPQHFSHLPTPDESPGVAGSTAGRSVYGDSSDRTIDDEDEEDAGFVPCSQTAAKASIASNNANHLTKPNPRAKSAAPKHNVSNASTAPSSPKETCSWPLAEYLSLLIIKTFGHWGFDIPVGGTVLQSCQYTNLRLFVHQVLNRTSMSFNAITLAIMYLQKLKQRHPQCRSAAVGSSARLMLAAIVISNKMLQDDCYDNKTWATVSGFAIAEINKMEHELLHFCSYDMHVPASAFAVFQQRLYIAIKVCTERLSTNTYCDASFNLYHQQNQFIIDEAFMASTNAADNVSAPLTTTVVAPGPIKETPLSMHESSSNNCHSQRRNSRVSDLRQQETHYGRRLSYPSPRLSPHAQNFVPLPPSPQSPVHVDAHHYRREYRGQGYSQHRQEQNCGNTSSADESVVSLSSSLPILAGAGSRRRFSIASSTGSIDRSTQYSAIAASASESQAWRNVRAETNYSKTGHSFYNIEANRRQSQYFENNATLRNAHSFRNLTPPDEMNRM